MTAPSWYSPVEWPKLDLAKHHLTRLALAWNVPHSPQAEQLFAELLDDDGSFAGVLSYTRRKVLHYRVEAAQLAAENDPLVVTVQYQADTGLLLQIPKFMQDGAWLLEPLQRLSPTSPVLCHADFAYESSPRLQTTPVLPMQPPEDDRYSYDEIVGVRGVKQNVAFDDSLAYTFTLDRLPSGDVALALDFVLDASPADEMPERALNMATFYARFLVVEKRK